ncbi:MAG: glutamine amidotransferase [Actinomycetaceae bacterium]|nr:glutamine amidotransferase [Actinomycetaceae bacterium]
MTSESTLTIGVLVPEVLGTYGDSGNAVVLAQRARWRGFEAEVVEVNLQSAIPRSLDIYTMGGGEDTAQALASRYLRGDRGLHDVVAKDRPVLAICAGMQVLGEWYTDATGRKVEGVGLLDLTTEPQDKRSIGELVTEPFIDGVDEFLTGFENHGGATTLGDEARPLGRVIHGMGNGGAGVEPVDGCLQGSIVATYMHGPVLARNPLLADYLLSQAVGEALKPLDNPEICELRQQRLSAAAAV